MRTILMAGLAAISLSACATLEPEPCSADWVEWKTERILKGFAQANASEIRKIRNFAATLSEGEVGPITALRIPSMIESFKGLAIEFRDTTLPELNAAVEQCGSVEKLVPAFTNFLKDQDVDDSILEWVDALGTLIVDE